uniref:phosphatidylinositol transfer protein 3-like n=1 Tax=Ziziphus jujuba TaxID=326968 RepID=A0A6P3ZVD7_ZIZJJ
MSIKKSASNVVEKILTYEEQQAKINEVRSSLGTLSGKSSVYCSDASIARHLTARNWNVKKATKMLKETLKWRSEYKPEEIRWEEVAKEAETGKIYRSNYVDKHGRTVLVMRPSCQNSKSTKGQIRYLVYCMENAVLNLPPHQDKMVWLIDFQGFNMSHISVKVTKETAHVLQDHYPERLGLAILYNPPKFFEPFFTLVKPFLEPKTYNKVKFAYSDDLNAKKIMEDLFDMDKLESAFGGNDTAPFDINKYAERMKEDDKKMPALWGDPQSTLNKIPSFVSTKLGSDSESSDNEKTDSSKRCGSEPELVSSDDSKPLAASSGHPTEDVHGTKPEVFSSDNSIPVAASSRNPAEVV